MGEALVFDCSQRGVWAYIVVQAGRNTQPILSDATCICSTVASCHFTWFALAILPPTAFFLSQIVLTHAQAGWKLPSTRLFRA